MTTTTLVRDLQEMARRLQAQAGSLQHQLRQPTVDLAAVVQQLGIIEDTAHGAIVHVHVRAKDSTP